MLAGHPFWMPFNVSTQAIQGPEVRHIDAVDLPHTGLGLAIHLISCLFWAGIATVLLRLSARPPLRLWEQRCWRC